MNVPSRLSRYIFVQTLGGVAIAAAMALSAIVLVDVVEQVRVVGTRAELSLSTAAQLTALRAPYLFEQTLPFVILAGILFSMVRLTRRNEITIMRASGISPWRLAFPAMTLAVLIGMASTAALSPLGSILQRRYEIARNAITNTNAAHSDAFWISQGDKDGEIILRAERADPGQARLFGVTAFLFFQDKQNRRRFLRRLEAREAELVPGAWRLLDVQEASPFDLPAHHDEVSFASTLGREAFSRNALSPALTSVYSLPRVIRTSKLAGLAPRAYEVRLHTLLAVPILLAAMALIAVAFSNRLHRLGGVSSWIALGVGTGFTAYFLGQISGALASIGAAPAIAAGWGPPMAALFAAGAALSAGESLKS